MKRFGLFRGVILAGVSLGAGCQAAYAQVAEESHGRQLEEIVVTAERRETNLQSTPIAVTALTDTALKVNRVQNLTDLNNLAPGLIAQRSGSQNSVVYTMRGESSAGYLPGQASGIGTYIDGVYLGILTGTNFELAEIERVEVLRGPQGTLFGQNSTGGAISVTTRKPSGEFSARQELTYGNFDQMRSRTRVDLPAFGPFSLTFIYLHNERKGDTRNLGAGTQWDFGPLTGGRWGVRTSPKRFGDQNNDAWGVNLMFKPNPDIEMIYRYDGSNNVFTDRAQGILGDPNNVAASIPIPFFAGLYSAIPANIRTPISLTRPEAVNNYFSLPFRSKAQNHTFNATFQVGDNLVLRNITGYRAVKMEVHSMLDSALGGNTVAPFFPFTFQSASSYNKDHMFSTEVQAIVTTTAFNLTTGFYYFKNYISNGPRVAPGACTSGACASSTATQPYVIAPGTAQRSIGRGRTMAVYAQANVHLTSQLDLQGGLRYSWDRTKGVDALSGFVQPLDYKDDRLSWLGGINYQASDQVYLYAKAAKGYIRGGQIGGLDFDPETALSFEAGVKADLADRSLRANLSVYQVKYKNLQQAGLLPRTPPLGGLTVIFAIGDTKVKGVELETTWLTPLEGLTLAGSAAYTDFKYTRFNPDFLLFNGLQPSQMRTLQPKWTGNLNATYTSPTMENGASIVARLDGNFQFDRDLSNAARSALTDQYIHVKSRAIINGRLALQDIPLGRIKGELAIWGRNLTDNKGAQNVTYIGYNSVNYEPERTFGVDLNFEF